VSPDAPDFGEPHPIDVHYEPDGGPFGAPNRRSMGRCGT
jgi:hypothetical protein